MQQNGLLQSRNVPSFIPVQQCLFFDFYTVFSKSESIAQNMVQGSSIRIEGALHLSKRYKAAIKRALKMLDQAEYNEGQSQVTLQELGEELCSAELLWSLIEAVSIRPSRNLLVIDLLEWARECFPSTQSQIPSSQEGMMANSSFLGPIMDELMQQERPELHESYWNAVIRQSLCADFPTVATLLQFHSAFKNDQALAKMVKILLAANSDLFKSDRSNCDEFIKLQKKVRDLVARKELFRAHDNLGVICSLLIGDKGTFKKYFDLYRPNWFEVFPAFILFFYPNADGRQMPKIAENYFSLLGLDRRQLSKIERTVLAIFELDLIQALRLICSAGQSTCWFATHLVDLLHFHDPTFLGASNEQFQIYTTTKSTNQPEIDDLSKLNLRSRLLIEYGQLLFADAQLWEIGSEYLLASGIQNAQKMLDRIIGELNWHGNGTMAEKLIQICERFELQNAKETILKEITMKFCRQFEWSSALNWALRMENNDLAVQVTRQILQGAIPAARIGQMRIFESMAEQFVSAAELVLLYKFYTFRRRLFDGELRQAIQLLHELFLDNSSPIEFHVVLCEEMIRILATFQRPLVGPDAIAEPIDAIPGLDRDSVQDMFRALSKLQLQQNLLKAATTGEKELQENALFPNEERNMPEMKVYERLLDLMQTLRPMLAEALAACACSLY